MLALIAKHPEVSAGELAEISGFEKAWLKVNVRKLKELGLTESLQPGYRLSPRGRAYWEKARRKVQ
jgi:DNA-binding MarR family transcriptional regulator